VAAKFEIRAAQASDLGIVTAWLDGAGLPFDDLSAAHMELFLLATKAAKPVGMIGLERFADLGLLRSLLVENACRGNGLGAQLVAALEAKAQSHDIAELWLLTIDADPFFARLGFDIVERVDAPASIQATAEYSSLCPGDAVLMCKQLAVA